MAMTRDCDQTLEVTPTLYNLSLKFQFKLAVKFYQGGAVILITAGPKVV